MITASQKKAVLKVLTFQRLPGDEKLRVALQAYRQRVFRSDRHGQQRPEKIRVRVTHTRKSRRQLFVVQVRRSYVAAYTLDKLLQKIVLGPWNRVDIPCGAASGALV